MSYQVRIGKSSNYEKEIYKSCLFYDELEISLIENNKIIKKVSILPNRVSFFKNRELIEKKIELLKERYLIKKLEKPKGKINFFVKLLYCLILIINNIWIKFLSPAQWVIGFKLINENEWTLMKLDWKKMWADPFVVYENGKYYVFFEELYFKENKGHICVGELDLESKHLKNIKVILKNEYHFSYPFIFKENGKWYLIPETSENKTIDLYEAKQFPDKWEFKQTILKNIDAVDTTLVKLDDIWYLFTSEKNFGSTHNDELSLWKSQNLFLCEFEKLKNNPIVTDIKNARMGGKIFFKDNKLYRISQDCSKRYGYKINLNEIINLKENDYKERFIKKFSYPKEKNIIAMHTYNFDEEIAVADFKIIRRDINSIIRIFISSFKKILKFRRKNG